MADADEFTHETLHREHDNKVSELENALLVGALTTAQYTKVTGLRGH